MARYKDNLIPGSFRGVPFFTESHDYDGGRRAKMHEYAGRNTPNTETLGRKGRVYSIQGYLIGDDVFDQRRRFIEALERDGYGVLIHPYFGAVKVEVGPLKVSETILQGRICRFTCEFYEKGEDKNPGGSFNKLGRFFSKVGEKVDVLKQNFQNDFVSDNVPQYILEAASDIADTLNDVFLSAFTQLANASAYSSLIKRKVLRFQDNVQNVVSDVPTFSDDVVELVFDIGAITDSHKEKQRIYNQILTLEDELDDFPETTDTRSIQRSNRNALVNLVKVSTYIVAMRDFVSAVNDTYPDEDQRLRYAINDAYFSFSDLEAKQKELFDGFQDLITSEENDAIFDHLNELSSLIFASLPSPDDPESKIKRVVDFVVPETMSSLMLVYDLYESPENEEDLIRRNYVQNPLFINGGQELEVVSE